MKIRDFIFFVAVSLAVSTTVVFAYFLVMPAPSFGPVNFKVTAQVPKEFSYGQDTYALNYIPGEKETIWLCSDARCNPPLSKVENCTIRQKCELGGFIVIPLQETSREIELKIESQEMHKRTISEAMRDTFRDFFGIVV